MHLLVCQSSRYRWHDSGSQEHQWILENSCTFVRRVVAHAPPLSLIGVFRMHNSVPEYVAVETRIPLVVAWNPHQLSGRPNFVHRTGKDRGNVIHLAADRYDVAR